MNEIQLALIKVINTPGSSNTEFIENVTFTIHRLRRYSLI